MHLPERPREFKDHYGEKYFGTDFRLDLSNLLFFEMQSWPSLTIDNDFKIEMDREIRSILVLDKNNLVITAENSIVTAFRDTDGLWDTNLEAPLKGPIAAVGALGTDSFYTLAGETFSAWEIKGDRSLHYKRLIDGVDNSKNIAVLSEDTIVAAHGRKLDLLVGGRSTWVRENLKISDEWIGGVESLGETSFAVYAGEELTFWRCGYGQAEVFTCYPEVGEFTELNKYNKNMLLASTEYNELYLMRLTGSERLAGRCLGELPFAPAKVDSNGKGLCFFSDGSCRFLLCEGKSFREADVLPFSLEREVTCTRLIKDDLIACGCSDGTMYLLRKAGGKWWPRSYPLHEDSISSINAYEGNSFISVSKSGHVRIWSIDGTKA